MGRIMIAAAQCKARARSSRKAHTSRRMVGRSARDRDAPGFTATMVEFEKILHSVVVRFHATPATCPENGHLTPSERGPDRWRSVR